MGKLRAEVYIEQVRRGLEYRGHVHFGQVWKFDYRMIAQRNIETLEELSPEAANREIDLHLVENEARKEIPTEVLPLFRGLILPVAIDFYRQPQAIGYASSEFRELEREMKMFDASISIGMTTVPAIFEEEKLKPFMERAFPN